MKGNEGVFEQLQWLNMEFNQVMGEKEDFMVFWDRKKMKVLIVDYGGLGRLM